MKYLFITLGILVIGYLFFILPLTGFYYGYSDGERTGDIYKFSKKGIFWKSWEGEMYLGGLVSNGQALEMEKFYFSIQGKDEKEKTELIEKIKNCSQDRTKKCTILYKQWMIRPIRINSSYEVIGVL